MQYVTPTICDGPSLEESGLLGNERDVELEQNFAELMDFECRKHELVLALGGIPILFRVDDPELAAYLERDYGAFREDRPPAVTVDVKHAREFPFRTLVARFMLYRQGDIFSAKFRTMVSRASLSGRSVKAWITARNYRQDFLNLMRLVVGTLMPQMDALLFHTAAVAHRGKAWLFFGPSTAGKSTVVGLSRDRTIMTDDMLMLRQEGEQVIAASCGFWGGETSDIPSERIELPVAAFLRLHKADHNRLRPMDSVRAAFEIACHVPGIKRSPEEHKAVLNLAIRASRSAPCYDLHFQKRDASFWRCLDEL